MKIQYTFLVIILTFCFSLVSLNAQITKNQFKSALDEDSPIFQIQSASDSNVYSGNVGDVLFTQTATYQNLQPDSNLVNYIPLTYELVVAGISADELVLEPKSYNHKMPDNVLPWRQKIPLPLTGDETIELELLPTLKNIWRKSKFIVRILPAAQFKINSIENGVVEIELTSQFETWAFSPDLNQRLIVIDNDDHGIYNLPPYTVELVD